MDRMPDETQVIGLYRETGWITEGMSVSFVPAMLKNSFAIAMPTKTLVKNPLLYAPFYWTFFKKENPQRCSLALKATSALKK